MLVNITPLSPGIFLLLFPNGSLMPTLEEERDNVEKKKTTCYLYNAVRPCLKPLTIRYLERK